MSTVSRSKIIMSTPNVSHRNKFYKFYRKKVITEKVKVEIDITKSNITYPNLT